MFKAIAASLAIAGLGLTAGMQPPGDEDYAAFADGWHMHPSTCIVHHQDEGEWVLGIRPTDTSIDFDVSSQSVRGLEHGGTAELELVLDGTSRRIADAATFNPGDGWQGYSFFQDAEMFATLRDAGRLELRRAGRVLYQLDLAGIGPAIDAGKACWDAMDDFDVNYASTDENAM